MGKNQPDFTDGNIAQHIRYLAIPSGIGMFFHTMYNVVDTYYAGVFSTDAQAALSLFFPVFFILLAFGSGLGTAVSVLVANAMGAKKEKTAQKAVFQSLTYGIILSILLTIGGLLCSEKLFVFMGAEAQYLDFAMAYARVIFGGSCIFIFTFIFQSILSAVGDTKSFRNILILGFFLNIILDPWFLFGGFGLPALGIAGIAWATLVTTLIEGLYMFYKTYKLGIFEGFRGRDLWPQKKMFTELTQQGLPASLNMMTISLGIFIITYFVSMYGKEAVAAYGITTRIEQVAILPSLGINVAVLTLVGQNNGAGKHERILKILRQSLVYAAWIIGVGTVFLFFGAEPLMQLFSKDARVVAIGIETLHIVAFLSYAYMLNSIYISALQGIRKPAFAFWIGIYRQLILPLIFFYWIVQVWQLDIVYIWWALLFINWSAVAITFSYARVQFSKLGKKTMQN